MFDCSCWREARINSASTFADGFSGFSTTSCVKAANPMNSMRTTYLPRGIPEKSNLPSEFVAAAYFFPVSVFAAVTVTPGSGVLALRAEPLISYAGAAAGAVVDVGGGAGGGASCARNHGAKRITTALHTRMPRAMDFKCWSPRITYGCGGLLFGAVAGLFMPAPFPVGPIPALLRISSICFHCSGEKSIRFFGTNTFFSTAPRTIT